MWPLQGSAVAAQEVVWAVSPGRQLHIANCRPVLPRAQRQRLAVDQEAVRALPAQHQHMGVAKQWPRWQLWSSTTHAFVNLHAWQPSQYHALTWS